MDFMTSWLGLGKALHHGQGRQRLHAEQHAARRHGGGDARADPRYVRERRHVQRSAHRRPLVPEQGPGAVLRVRQRRARHDVHARAVPGLDLARRRHPGAREHPDRLRARRHLVAHAARAPGAHAPLVPVREPAGRVARHHVPARPQPDDHARALRERARARRLRGLPPADGSGSATASSTTTPSGASAIPRTTIPSTRRRRSTTPTPPTGTSPSTVSPRSRRIWPAMPT